MPSTRNREARSKAPTPVPVAATKRGSRRGKAVEEDVPAQAVEEVAVEEEDAAAEEEAEAVLAQAETEAEDVAEDEGLVGDVDVEEAAGAKPGLEDRLAKLKELRLRMNQSSAANRRDLIIDHQKQKVTAKDLQRLEKQKKLAQTLRLKADAEENGEDLDRKKNWGWSIEDNERWERKQEDIKEKGDSSFHNAEDDAHKLYNRNLKSTKPDLLAYERQKELALGLAPGTLVPVGSSSASILAGPSSSSRTRGLTASEDLYRGADTLVYGDSKPSEDAVDRVISKINKDLDKGKRKKKEDEDEEVTYINERNKVFNKKIARYFDKYTKEIRANFERGTAL